MTHISAVVAQFESVSYRSERRAAITKGPPPSPYMFRRDGPFMDACVLEFVSLNLNYLSPPILIESWLRRPARVGKAYTPARTGFAGDANGRRHKLD